VALYAVKARGRDGWAFHDSPDSGAGDPPGAAGGLLKTAS